MWCVFVHHQHTHQIIEISLVVKFMRGGGVMTKSKRFYFVSFALVSFPPFTSYTQSKSKSPRHYPDLDGISSVRRPTHCIQTHSPKQETKQKLKTASNKREKLWCPHNKWKQTTPIQHKPTTEHFHTHTKYPHPHTVMGGGESKMESAKVKLQAMSAMQAKMEKLETDLAHKDRALEYERRLVAAHADVGEELRMEINELSKPKPVAKKKHKKKSKTPKNQEVNKKRMDKLAKMSSWSLEPEIYNKEPEPELQSESEPEPEPDPEPEPEPELEPTPTNAVADILGNDGSASNHFKKVEAQLTALNAFKKDFQEDLMASKSKLRQRIQKRRSQRSIKKRNSSLLSSSLDSSSEFEELPLPPLPPRPKVTGIEYHTYNFGPGTLGINFEEMKDEPPFSMFVWSVVTGWQGHTQGIQADDVLIQINDIKLEKLDFDVVMEKLLSAPRPMVLKVRRDTYANQGRTDEAAVHAAAMAATATVEAATVSGEVEQPSADTIVIAPPPLPPKKKPKVPARSKASEIQDATETEIVPS